MTFRKISLTFLIIILGAACAHAKTKEPKYGQARQLTAEQAALVQKAVASEKVLIRSIRQRTSSRPTGRIIRKAIGWC